MKGIKIILLLCTVSLMSFSNRSTVEGCSILHRGTFKYKAGKRHVKVVIDGENHTEYHNGGKYIIQSKLVWVNTCAYKTTLLKVTIPECPYKTGDVMHVKVDKVIGKDIFYTATLKGQSWEGMLTKVK
jgi:hypothetical protein